MHMLYINIDGLHTCT